MNNWRKTIWGELSAEFLGAMIIMSFGNGVNAMIVAALNQSGRGNEAIHAGGDWLLITWGWALAVTLAIYVAGGVSGAHLNPAVTIALAVKRGFEWKRVPGYIAAQMVGAFTGAALVYFNYSHAIRSFESAKGIVRGSEASAATFGIFATAPAPYYGGGMVGPLIDQIIGTMFLVLLVLAIGDELNSPVQANLAPILVGFIVAAIGMSFGANAGYAINPARDFGPRLLAYFAGWGNVALPGIGNYFWVPILGPIIGGTLGAYVYDFFIHDILQARRKR